MYLTLDFGNTASKYALFNQEGILHSYGSFDGVEALGEIEISACIFSTVKKEIPWLSDLKCPVHLFNLGMNLPIQISYTTPETLGLDRLAGILGAHHLSESGQACLVIDAGTCITFDYLDDSNTYLGGSISPGMHMRYLALHQQTGKLPLVSHEVFQGNFGQSTNEAILCGVQQGILGESRLQIDCFLENFPNGNVFITGGDHNLLAEHVKTKIFVEPQLVHYGLMKALMFHESQK